MQGNNLDNEIVDYVLGIEDSKKGLNGLKILYVDKRNLND